LDKPEVDSKNNHAERQIRPAVIKRKNQLCNPSDAGARTQSVMLTIFRTLKLRGHDATQVIVAGLGEMLRSGSLPRLTDCAANG